MSDQQWRDARLKKALDSAPDADARPADAVREAILHKARLTAAAAVQPAARRSPRFWRWLGSVAAVGALAIVLVGGRQFFLADQAAPPAAQVAQVAQVAAPPAPETAEIAKPAAAPPPPDVVVADARNGARPAVRLELARRKVEQSAKQHAASAAPPPVVVAEATAPPPAAAPAPPPAAAPARVVVPAAPAWTELRIATADGPVTLRREQLSAEAAGRLSRLLAAAESEQQLRTQLADGRQAGAAAQSFSRSPAVPGPLRIELLLGDRPAGSLVLRPGDPLRLELEAAAAKPASAP